MDDTRAEKIKTVFRVTSGNFLEMFDFFLFGIYASHIAHTFFPNENELVSLMSTFLSFAAGFVMRPIGALTLGPYIDRIGRRKGLIVTLALMAMGTALIVFVPGYATIGIAAPLLVLVGRLLQGFSAGVELGGVSVYLAEMATPGRKGFYVSWQSASQQVAIIVAALIGFTLNKLLMPQQISEWGWRIPFAIGCLIIPFIFVIRRSLQETAEFAARAHKAPTTGEVFRTLAANWAVVLGGVGMVIMTTVSFYLITVYTPSFGKTVLKLPEADALLVTIAVGLSNFIWLPVSGAVSDRIGRKPILIGFSLLAVFTAYPALAWLIRDITFGRMLAVELWLSFIYAWYNGAMVVALTEVVPVNVRTAGFSLAYSLATTLGGSSLAISTWLIETTQDKAAPGYWMGFAGLCGLVASLFLYRKGGKREVIEAKAVPGKL
ncbi:MFS transporter [Rhizobium paknamense]|uniref:MHS family citrate/tricarballylate:H+ symporter-like MFS transporter n=1 Tax=Rhizobium paknamense TaxID=1206817 RepID=A0ABU0I9Y4_9HYPH|nr:MFS transporter [Rhizobium paknamense]MDQ0455044.1 MHS family citrate/tricarballylate:H+ symporter-like MFS transporter [Rhizobium paknamense]